MYNFAFAFVAAMAISLHFDEYTSRINKGAAKYLSYYILEVTGLMLVIGVAAFPGKEFTCSKGEKKQSLQDDSQYVELKDDKHPAKYHNTECVLGNWWKTNKDTILSVLHSGSAFFSMTILSFTNYVYALNLLNASTHVGRGAAFLAAQVAGNLALIVYLLISFRGLALDACGGNLSTKMSRVSYFVEMLAYYTTITLCIAATFYRNDHFPCIQ